MSPTAAETGEARPTPVRHAVKFIVHIGDGKCGSTAIQAGLYAARHQLREKGVIYETAKPASGHFGLVRLTGHATRGNDAAQTEAAWMTVSRIREQLRQWPAHSETPPTVLLSAESFFSVPPDQLLDILRTMATQVARLDVIAYVRPPSAMYLSLVQQELKGNSRFTPPAKYRRRVDEVVERWARAEQCSSFTLRVFDRSCLEQGNVVHDFSAVVGGLIGDSSLQLPADVKNQSITAEQLVVLQHYRRTVLGELDGQLHRASARLLSFFEALNRLFLAGNPLRLSAAAQAAVASANRDIVDHLNQLHPGLELTDVAEDDAPTADAAIADAFTQDVASILERVDDTVVAQLTALIPDLSEPLRAGDDTAAFSAVTSLCASLDEERRNAFVEELARYLTAAGAEPAAVALRLRTLSD